MSSLQCPYQAGLLPPTLFGSAQAPLAVAAELAEGGKPGIRLPELVEISWMTVRPVRDRTLLPLATSLGSGEKKKVLALGTPDLVLDDRNVRRHAEAAGLEITGALGILVLARGLTVRPILNRLQALRFRIAVRSREMVLDLADERHR